MCESPIGPSNDDESVCLGYHLADTVLHGFASSLDLGFNKSLAEPRLGFFWRADLRTVLSNHFLRAR